MLLKHELQEPQAEEPFTPSPGDSEVSIFDLVLVLAKRKKLIFWITGCAVLCGALTALLLPTKFTANTRVFPPQQGQSIAMSMLGQFAPLAGLAGKDLGLKGQNDMYLAMLKSRVVADALIERFHLQSLYHKKYMADVRERLTDDTDIQDKKEGAIWISVDAETPQLAADLANGYVEELYKLNSTLATSEAGQRRAFYEQELKSTKDQLANAEVQLKQTQERSGLIQLDAQAKAMIESIAILRAQISARELQLKTLHAYATEQNPQVTRAEQELSVMRSQLAEMQKGHAKGNGDPYVPTGSVPAEGLEYIRKLRDVKYFETLFEMLSKQYEIARLEEAKSASVIQVLDKAIPPEKRSKPKRLLIVIAAALGGFLISLFCAAALEMMENLRRHPQHGPKIALAREYFQKK